MVMMGTCTTSLKVMIPFSPIIRNNSGEVRFWTINVHRRHTRSMISASFVSRTQIMSFSQNGKTRCEKEVVIGLQMNG